jgi:hypothetical protein
MPISLCDIGRCPAHCAASTTKITPLLRQSSPISRSGIVAEQMLLAPVQISIRVFLRIRLAIFAHILLGERCGSSIIESKTL